MADKIKDAEDQMLESLFQAEAIADDGFSARVTGRIRRRLWLRRIILPLAFVLGGAIAFKPAVALLSVTTTLLSAATNDLLGSSVSWLPPLPMVVAGGMLLAAMMLGLRMLED